MRSYSRPTRPPRNLLASVVRGLDRQVHLATRMRPLLNRAFPTHWSRFVAWIATSSLVVLILTGGYLALFFDPSMTEVTYDGPVENLRGVEMTRSYATTLEISFEIRGGLLVRQIHSWAASLFLAALLIVLAITFFTGAFRRPRRAGWVISVLLLLTAVFEAFTGVLLLGDLLSGTSLRMISGYVISIPVIGTWLHWTLFGGEFPSVDLGPQLYFLHLLLPLVMIGLMAARAALASRQPQPQFRGRHRTERNVVGVRMLPGFAGRAVAMFVITVGVLAVMGGLFQINPVWNYGPANAPHVSAGSAPPWYFGWVDGAVRLWPPWDIHLGDYTISAVFWPSMVFLPLSFLLLALYPWLEQRFTRDREPHHLLQRPRDVPGRTSLGVAVLTLYICLQLVAAIDVLAARLALSGDALLWGGRIGVVVLPLLAYTLTYRLCLGLQRADRAVLHHGIPTGILSRLPHGGFVESHEPLGHESPEYRGTPVPKKLNQLPPPVRRG